MATPYYVKLPEYKAPELDVSPLTNAFREITRSQEADRAHALNKERVGLEAERVGIARRAQDREDEKLEDEKQQKQIKQIAGIAQYIDELPDDNPQKSVLSSQLISHNPNLAPSLKRYGVDPSDHKTAIKFLIKEAAGYQDEGKRKLLDAQTDYYAAGAESRRMNADTRRIKAYGDVVDRLGPNPDPAMFDRENREGGIIHAAFGGPVDRNQWGRMFQLAQARRSGIPGEEELLNMGIDPKTVNELRVQNAITRLVGKAPEKGQVWAIEGGRIVQKRISQAGKPLTENEKALAVNAYTDLQDSMDVLIGKKETEGENKGQRMGRGSAGAAGIGIASMPGGQWLNGETAIALNRARSAVMNLSYFLSGKQIGNQEQLRLVEQYVPKAGDRWEMRKAKMQAAERFFTRMKQIHESGGDVMQFIKDDAEAGRPADDTPATPSKKGGRLYDKYGLE